MEKINSRNNENIIKAVKLKQKKNRDAQSLFYFEGLKLCSEAINANIDIKRIYATEAAICENRTLLPQDITVCVSDDVYKKLSDESAPQGIFCIAQRPAMSAPTSESKIIIESVRDPGNIGTILRTALAFGIGEVIFSDDCADPWSAKVCRSAMGALFRQCFRAEKNIPQLIDKLRNNGYNLCAATLAYDSVPLDSISVGAKTCFVIGNEGHGISDDTVNKCDKKVIIPIAPHSESLNAAIAAAILMWEVKNGQKRAD